MPGKVSRYKAIIRTHLEKLGWEREIAAKWLTKNDHYVRAMCESACPAFETANLINKYRRNEIAE